LAIRRRRICGAKRRLVARRATAKRACYTGIVKNQQRSATEVLQIGSGEKTELLNFPPSRDKSSSAKPSRSARLAQTASQFASSRRRRRSAGFARRQTRVSHRDCEKSAGFNNGSVANHQQ
jgi:hypothetical protein